MTKGHHHARPFGDLVGPTEDAAEVLTRLREGFVTPTVLKRTISSLVAHLQGVAKPGSEGATDADRWTAKRTLDLIAEIYREALERRVRT